MSDPSRFKPENLLFVQQIDGSWDTDPSLDGHSRYRGTVSLKRNQGASLSAKAAVDNALTPNFVSQAFISRAGLKQAVKHHDRSQLRYVRDGTDARLRLSIQLTYQIDEMSEETDTFWVVDLHHVDLLIGRGTDSLLAQQRLNIMRTNIAVSHEVYADHLAERNSSEIDHRREEAELRFERKDDHIRPGHKSRGRVTAISSSYYS